MTVLNAFESPAKPSGPVFIGLNILRLLSIVALLLVLASNCVTMSDDIKAVKESHAASSSNSTSSYDSFDVDCDYVEYSTVPDQTGGAFWSILNRLFILFECVLLVASEIGVPRRLFDTFIPVLGSQHGLGCLGALQALVGASVLSHYCDVFSQVSAWILFIIGCLNMVAGIAFRDKAKQQRLIFSWENAASLTPPTRVAYAGAAYVSEKLRPFRANSATSASTASELPRYAYDTPQPQPQPRPDPGAGGVAADDSPLVPGNARVEPGARIGAEFGGQGRKKKIDIAKISRPAATLMKNAF
ncbi:hypothetical protein Q5752_002322 [Cryptotrichosporon argae]